MTVLLDSWAWVEYFKGTRAGALIKEHVDSSTDIVASSINIAEVAGFLLKTGNDLVFAEFIEQRSVLQPVTADIATIAAKMKHRHKMGLADAIIYATAQEHGATLITGDPDFKGKKNVLYIGP